MPSGLHPHVARMAAAMAAYPAAWALCGGWAVDYWLGRQTRDHRDIDITVFVEDQVALFAHLRDWNMVPHDAVTPEVRDLWDGRTLVLPAHIHARPPGEENRRRVISWVTPPYTQAADGEDLELVVNERQGGDWILHDEARISRPLDRCVATAPGGLPVARPEVLLFYKATAYWGDGKHPRSHDTADFKALAPLLAPNDAAWLRTAIHTCIPDHPWLAHLAP